MIKDLKKNIKINPFVIAGLVLASVVWSALTYSLGQDWKMNFGLMLFITVFGYSSVSLLKTCKTMYKNSKKWKCIGIGSLLLLLWAIVTLISVIF